MKVKDDKFVKALKQQICDALRSEQHKVMDGDYDDYDGFNADDLIYNVSSEVLFVQRCILADQNKSL